ncbi:MAG: nuclear transport factor 2 family protein [Myxococcota bacterium]
MSFDSVSSSQRESAPRVLERRADELAIRELAFRYARIVDRRVYDEIPEVFAPDCELSGVGFRMRGHAELDAGLRKIEMYSATQHCVHNQLTRVEGDRASGEFYCVAAHIHEREGVAYKLDMGIRYDDRYVRTAGGWRIAHRVLNLIWQQDLPLDLAPPARPRARPRASGTTKKRSTPRAEGKKRARPAARAKATTRKRAAARAGASRKKSRGRRPVR